MNERRRKFIKTAGIALLPAIAGCAEQSDGGTDGEPGANDGSTPDSTTTAPQEMETPTETEASEPGTDTPTETETASSTETLESTDAVTLIVSNVGVSAWEVVEDESGSVAPTGEDNPTLSLAVGQRYAVENRGWSAHPFAIRDADDAPLLSQSADGQFENDDAVDWTDDGETFAFTFTEDLAAAADYYICTVHSGMRGDVDTA